MSIRTDVRDILQKISLADIPEILDEQDLSKYLIDSMERVEFLLDLEDKFGVHIQDDVSLNFKTFGDVVREIERLTRQ